MPKHLAGVAQLEERCAETAEIGGSKPSSSANTRVAQPGQSGSFTSRRAQVRIRASGTTFNLKGMAQPGPRRLCRKQESEGSNPSPLTKRPKRRHSSTGRARDSKSRRWGFKSCCRCQLISSPGAAGVVVAQRLSARLWPESCRFDSDRSLQRCPVVHREVQLCARNSTRTAFSAFEPMSKRRRGFPSERQVKRGLQIVHGDKWLEEKLGRNDPCPCGSGRRFQELLHAPRPLSTAGDATTTSVSNNWRAEAGLRCCPAQPRRGDPRRKARAASPPGFESQALLQTPS